MESRRIQSDGSKEEGEKRRIRRDGEMGGKE